MRIRIPFVLLLAACAGRERERQIADCLAIQRTMYVTGELRECLVRRYGWKHADAVTVERDRLGGVHPDSASEADSGRVGPPSP